MPAGNGITEAAAKKSPRRLKQTGQPVAGAPAAPPAGEPGAGSPATAPLSAVVSNAVRRWFVDTHKETIRGDVVRIPEVGFLFKGFRPVRRRTFMPLRCFGQLCAAGRCSKLQRQVYFALLASHLLAPKRLLLCGELLEAAESCNP